MDPVEHFRELVANNIRKIGEDRDFIGLSNIWVRESIRHGYAQNFTWLAGRSSRCRRISMRSRN